MAGKNSPKGGKKSVRGDGGDIEGVKAELQKKPGENIASGKRGRGRPRGTAAEKTTEKMTSGCLDKYLAIERNETKERNEQNEKNERVEQNEPKERNERKDSLMWIVSSNKVMHSPDRRNAEKELPLHQRSPSSSGKEKTNSNEEHTNAVLTPLTGKGDLNMLAGRAQGCNNAGDRELNISNAITTDSAFNGNISNCSSMTGEPRHPSDDTDSWRTEKGGRNGGEMVENERSLALMWVRIRSMELEIEEVKQELGNCKKDNDRLNKKVRNLETDINLSAARWRSEKKEIMDWAKKNNKSNETPENSEMEIQEPGERNDNQMSQNTTTTIPYTSPSRNGSAEAEDRTQIPDKLPARELEYELRERQERKNSIIITGLQNPERKRGPEIRYVFEQIMGVTPRVKKIREVQEGTLVEFGAWNDKRKVMTKKKWLKGTNVWISDDLTPRERTVQEWLASVAKKKREEGHQVRIGYMMMSVNEDKVYWSEEDGRLERRRFRHQGEENQ